MSYTIINRRFIEFFPAMKYPILITVLLSFLCISSVHSQSDVQTPNTTVEFEATVLDFGTISKGSDGRKTFVFKNTGEEPLVISKVFSSSHLKVVKYPQEPVQPGEKEEIVIKYDTSRVGPIVKTVTVMMNIKEKAVPLQVKGEVKL